MATTPFDSMLYRDLFHDLDVGKLFTDSAEVRAMMIVEGALAKAQAETGLIPETAAAAIGRAGMEIQIDPGALAKATGENAVPVPALVAALREEMNAPEHAQFLHFGATSQDIMDTGLMLRMRQVLAILETRLEAIIAALGSMAKTHASTPMAGRTYGQTATFTSFGAVVASWGWPLIKLKAKLPALREEVLCVSLSGAAGTLSAMGDKALETRAAFAKQTGLSEPEGSWHSDRSRITSLAAWMTQLSGTLGKIGDDLIIMTSSDSREITLGGTGSSSTMPQKQNPVQPSVLVALARTVAALNTVIQEAAIHRQQRDGTAWMCEWMTLPQLCMATAKASATAQNLTQTLTPNTSRMRSNAESDTGAIYAEALSFTLAKSMPRPEAQAAVKELCKQAGHLKDNAATRFPDKDTNAVFIPENQLGTAPHEARAFVKAARA
jgi:3-carboxy-cis,cis-muconate cycloisomerase